MGLTIGLVLSLVFLLTASKGHHASVTNPVIYVVIAAYDIVIKYS